MTLLQDLAPESLDVVRRHSWTTTAPETGRGVHSRMSREQTSARSLLTKMFAQLLRIWLPFHRSRRAPVSVPTVKIVAEVARKHVQMVMPDLLAPGGFVVLPKRRPIATICCPQCQRDSLSCNLDRGEHDVGHTINVLEVVIRHDQNVTSIRRPPLGETNAVTALSRRTTSDCFV